MLKPGKCTPFIVIAIGAAITLLMGLTAYALEATGQKPQKSCEVSLAESSVRVHHLTKDREELEKARAELQTALYLLNQQKMALEKQLTDLTPKEDPKAAPKPENPTP